MDLLTKPGRISYGVAVSCFGAHYLLHVSKLIGPEPGPPWFSGPAWMSAVAGVALFLLGAAIALDWNGRWAALVVGLSLLIRVAVVHLPRLLTNLHDPGPWTSGAEI